MGSPLKESIRQPADENEGWGEREQHKPDPPVKDFDEDCLISGWLERDEGDLGCNSIDI